MSGPKRNFNISFMQLGYELIQASLDQKPEIQDFVTNFIFKLEKKYGEKEINNEL